jgi:predicted Zn-dependent peptidase
VIKYQLKNGLRVVLEKIPTCRSVSFGIWVKTGSRFENEHNNGISHLIEHMLFKGTKKYSARDIAEQFDGIGGNVNAFTSQEYTCYYAKVLDQHLPLAMDILSDMYFNSLMKQEDLIKEKNVILEEIAMYEDTPDDLVHDLIAKAAYGDHSLGYAILGTETNLSQIQTSDLNAYMDDHYHVNNTVISLAGNIDDSMIQLIEQYFGNFTNVKSEPSLIEPEFQGEQIFRSKKTEQNHICLSLPGCSLKDERLYAMVLLNNAIGGGMSSRLFQEIREDRGLAYSIYSYHSAHADSGLFTIYAGTAPKQTEEVLKVTMDVLEGIIDKQLSESELSKGKEQLKGSLILSLESTSSRMNRLGKNELMLGKHYSLDEIIERIEAVQMKDIRSLTSSLFSQSFALSMVGQSDQVLSKFRRDQLASNHSN